MTIEGLRKNKLIIFEYVRGSHMYHLNTETSDKDIGGVFVAPVQQIVGLRSTYTEQVSDSRHDTVYWEFGRWIELLLKSNPSVLESLFVPEDCIVGEVHPAIQDIISHRDLFLSKECVKSFSGYAISQIYKARGLNKKISNPVTERKDPLDFCYTFKNQGSQPIKKFLQDNHLNQRYCGLVNIPNMKDVYGVYYDWAAFFHFEALPDWAKCNPYPSIPYPYNKLIKDPQEAVRIRNRIWEKEFYGYEGIVNPDDYTKSNDIRLSAVKEGDSPICYLYFNRDGYTSHCKDYKEYKEWEAHRNPVRYESNLNKNYDSKNMMHCVRLLRMSNELLRGEGFNVVRDKDRDFLLDIRNHKYEYDEIMSIVNKEREELMMLEKTSTLKDHIDYDAVNKLLIDSRYDLYHIISTNK